MPGKRERLFPLLLPAVVFVPLGAIVLFLLVTSWHASDEREAAAARLEDAGVRAEAVLEDTVGRQAMVTDLLSRSPLVWLWVKFQGERLTASNRMHAEMSLAEIANYGKMVPGGVFFMASAKTGLLYRDGAPVRTLSRAASQDQWYYDALKTDSLITVVEGNTIRTSERIMNDANLLGVITCVRDAADLFAAVFPASLAARGVTGVLADAEGRILAATATGKKTVFELFPSVKEGALRAALQALEGNARPYSLTSGPAGQVVGLAIVAAGPLNGRLVVSAPVSTRESDTRIVLLAAVPAAALALLIAALVVIAMSRMRANAALRERMERENSAARTALTRIDAAARSAQSAAANLRTVAGALAGEAAAGLKSADEASVLFVRAEERDVELRSGVQARLSLLEEVSDKVREAVARSRGAQTVSLAIGVDAAQAEEHLSRVITSGAAAATAVERSSKGIESIIEAFQKLNLVSMNAALEAVRGGNPARSLSRIADEVRSLSEDAAATAKLLGAALSEAGERLNGIGQAAREAGGAVHAVAGAASESASAAGVGWEGVESILPTVEKAGVSGEKLKEQATLSDRGRSSLEGIARILARIKALAGQATDLSGSIASEAASAARTAANGVENH